MSFIDLNHAKNRAMILTTRYINILAGLEKKLVPVLVPSSAPHSDKERLRKIRCTMLKEFYKFMLCDQTDEFEVRWAALDSVITHLECAVHIDPQTISTEVWSNPAVLTQEAEWILDDMRTLNNIHFE